HLHARPLAQPAPNTDRQTHADADSRTTAEPAITEATGYPTTARSAARWPRVPQRRTLGPVDVQIVAVTDQVDEAVQVTDSRQISRVHAPRMPRPHGANARL